MITIQIGGREFNHDLIYDPTSPTTQWNAKRKEHYKIGEVIGENRCFVKRYQGTLPNAERLITQLQGQALNGMPQIYGLVPHTASGVKKESGAKNIYYYVTECLDGDTLDKFIIKQTPLNLKLMFILLLKALQQLEKYQFWFSDFNEQNIFYTPRNHKFYLIDVDSAWSNQYSPHGDAAEYGGLPSASLRYAALAAVCSQKILDRAISYTQWKGNMLNYLQLLTFMAHLKYHQQAILKDVHLPFSYSCQDDAITELIQRANPAMAKIVFEKGELNTLDFQFHESLSNLIDSIIRFDNWIAVKPNILRFDASANQAIKGQRIELKWEIEHATQISLESNQFPTFKVEAKGDKPYAIDKTTQFTLKATNPQGSIVQTLTVELTVQPTEIVTFRTGITNKLLEIDRGTSVDFIWIVLGSNEVKFENAGVKNRGKMTLVPSVTHTYKLTAKTSTQKTIEKLLTIQVRQPPKPWWHWFIVALLVIGTGYGGYRVIENGMIDNIPFDQILAESEKAYNQQDYYKVKRLCTRYLDKQPNSAQAAYWRGISLLKEGNKDKGCQDIQSAAHLLPADMTIRGACINHCAKCQ